MNDPQRISNRIVEHVASVFVGQRPLLEKLLAGALADGHVLFEDNPGLGKTLLVKTFARSIGCECKRIQFTPDLLPADVMGTRVWNQATREFDLARGPVFTHILLADEINRAPPKTQSALLEAMEERQVTIEGETLKLTPPFFVLATQNPIEQEGTYPLPEAQLDRFLLKLSTGYPVDIDREIEIMERRVEWRKNDPTDELGPVVDAEGFRELASVAENGVFVDREVMAYIARIVRGIREHPQVRVGPSPRGSLALLRVSRALAVVRGRDFVTPDDVKGIAVEALAHRTILELESVIAGVRAADVVAEVAARVPVPTRFAKPAAPLRRSVA